eukprot:2945087-Rhodomonas_salina.2
MVKDWIMAKELLQTASDKSNRLKAELREAEEQLDQVSNPETRRKKAPQHLFGPVKWATGHCLDVEAMSSLAGSSLMPQNRRCIPTEVLDSNRDAKAEATCICMSLKA